MNKINCEEENGKEKLEEWKLRNGKYVSSQCMPMRMFLYRNTFHSNEYINITALNLYKLFSVMERQVHECLTPPTATEQGIISRPSRVSVNIGVRS